MASEEHMKPASRAAGGQPVTTVVEPLEVLGGPFATAAAAYLDAGWHPLPVNGKGTLPALRVERRIAVPVEALGRWVMDGCPVAR